MTGTKVRTNGANRARRLRSSVWSLIMVDPPASMLPIAPA
ncbi:hypothetical protein PICSAR26_04639 [Mycobacterium avium subsp. paratuberculosis]|nr:hypothetical protein PICSAR26_04639 [Mycobacterium avium subsp. paratuberculosis]